jgi:hypothetical protein
VLPILSLFTQVPLERRVEWGMKIYYWRPRDFEGAPEWVEQKIEAAAPYWGEDGAPKPTSPLFKMSDEHPSMPLYQGYPFYKKPVPENTLLDVSYNTKTKDFRLNWSFSYGIITQNVSPCQIEVSDKPNGAFEIYRNSACILEKHATVPDAIYYMIQDKGGPSFFAVVLNENDKKNEVLYEPGKY